MLNINKNTKNEHLKLQWSEYWRERKATAMAGVAGLMAAQAAALRHAAGGFSGQPGGTAWDAGPMTDMAGLTGLMGAERAASEAAAAMGLSSSSSSSRGRAEGGEMDDEADSAWVHGKGCEKQMKSFGCTGKGARSR